MTDAVHIKDLSEHAANKVCRALYDVLELDDDHTVKTIIAIGAATVCIGTAAAALTMSAKLKGLPELNAKDASLAIINLLKLEIENGLNAALEKVEAAAHEARP